MSGGKFIIVVGSPECPGIGLPLLRRVKNDIEKVVSFFTNSDQKCERVLIDSLPLGATASQIRDGLSVWFSSRERRESDCVIVYFAGHGDSGSRFGDHCLFTANSDPRNPNSVIRTGELIRWFFDGEGPRPQNLLLILDVCYAGQGAGDLMVELAKARSSLLRAGGSGFWIIAASDSNTEAGDGTFVSAFLEVLKNEEWFPRGGAEYLSPAVLTEAINRCFEQKKEAQRALFYTIAGGRKEPPFIRNPRFAPELDGMTLSDQAHWEPKARGVDTLGAPGWFFTGRRQALRELSQWLQSETSDGRARIVAGSPGSGKSALLGLIVLATHPLTREGIQREAQWDQRSVPPIGAVSARVHARGMRFDTMASTLIKLLNSDATDVGSLIVDLQNRPGPIGILIDSLDEAADSDSIERELLHPLAICPSVRLIVGSRRLMQRCPLEGIGTIIDLDDPRYFERNDVIDYVFARLTARAPRALYSPEGLHGHARRIAGVVADRAGHSFLFARLVSRALVVAEAPVDTLREGWQHQLQLPKDLEEAFGTDLSRFGPETRRRIVDLLVPLAYARGKGIPQKNVWHTIASRIAGREYTNADLRELKEEAGYYLIQDTEAGEVVFRLFHQTFADYLKKLTQHEDVEQAFASALSDLLPRMPEGLSSWAQVGEPYLLNYFPSHARVANILDGFLDDIDFLLNISRESLLAELPYINSPTGRKITQAYRRASHWLTRDDEVSAIGYLLWAALQYSIGPLAEAARSRLIGSFWLPIWASWDVAVAGHVLAGGTDTITAVTTTHDEKNRPLIVCGYSRGTLRTWDMATGKMQFEYNPADLQGSNYFGHQLTHLAACPWENKLLIVAAWNGGSLRSIEHRSGRILGSWSSESGSRGVQAICCEQRGDAKILVIAEDRNLHRFELPDLKLETSVPNAAGATIYSLCSVDWHGTRALAVGSDSMRDGDRTELMLIRIRDFDKLLTLSEFAPAYSHESSSGSSGPIRIHSTVSVGGKDILLARDGASLVLFELGSGIEVTRLHSYSRMTSKIIAVVSKEHRTFVLGNSYGRLLAVELFSQAFDLTSSQHSTPMLVAHPLDTEIDLGGELWSQTINLHNRTVAANAQGPKLLLWDIDELSIASLNQSQSEVKDRVHFFGEGALNAVASNGMHVAAGGYDGNVWIWDMAGRLISKHQISGNAVQAMAFVTIDTTPVLLVASGNGVLHRIYVPAKPKAFPIIKTGEEIWGMALHTLDSQIIAFLAVNLNERGKQGRYVVRAWDIESGKEVNTNVDDDFSSDLGGTVQGWGLEALGYYRTKTLYAVSVLEWNDHVLISLAGPHGEVRTIDLNTFSQIDRWEGGVSGDYVHSLIAGIDGNTPLIFGGDEAGRLFCRDVSNKKEHCSRVDTAHRGSINSLLLPETKGGRILVSGGDDGIICFWTMDLRKLAQIETDRPVRALALPSNERLVVANDRGVTVLSLNWQQLTFNLCQ